MIWLLISILTNTLLLLILKGFERYGVNTLHGIVVNYAIAGTTGLLLKNIPAFTEVTAGTGSALWIPFVLGALFISIFFIIAKTAQTSGISIATVANKMSVVIPIAAAVFLYSEHLSYLKVAGIILALAAVWFTSQRSDGGQLNLRYLFYPALIFAGSGIIDALVNHLQKSVTAPQIIPFLLSVAFLSAFVIGLTVVLVRSVRGADKITVRSIAGGIILGVPNYFSIYAITKALDADIMQSSVLYPLNNMGIVLCSAIGAVILFREKLSLINWGGILLSVVAIGIIAFA
jgi:drug/metabolite transporter (DMT)-like permease